MIFAISDYGKAIFRLKRSKLDELSAPWKNALPPNGHAFLDDVMSESELTKVCYSQCFRYSDIRYSDP